MYEDMMENIGASDPKPVPLPSPTTGVERSVEKEERSADEIAAANKIRVQDRIDGKTTINGMVVGGIPKFKAGTVGVSPTIHKILTGYNVKQDPLTESNPTFSLLGNMNEKAHQVNIDALIKSEGKSGGAGMLYDPISNTFHGVSLSVKDISEGTSDFVEKLTGSSTGKRRNFVGKVPDTAVYKGKVYNTLDAKDYLALMDAMEAEARNVYDNHLKITKPTTDENQVDLTASDVKPIVSSEQILREGEDQQAGVSETEATQTQQDDNRDQERRTAREQQQAEQSYQKSIEADEEGGNRYDDVGSQEYMNTGGFIGGMNPDQVTDAQTVADDYPIDSDDGDFMINASIIEQRPDRFNEIISAGLQKAREKGIEVGDISGVGKDESGDVLASKGEFLVKKPLAEAIGYDVLNEFNDQGKPEVDRRVAASGGFLDGYSNGGEIDPPVSKPKGTMFDFYNAFKKKFDSPEEAREVAKEYFEKLEPEEALALTALAEAEVLDTDGLNGVMHVINNRLKSDYRNFGKQNSISDVIKQQTGKGAFEFTGLDPTSLRATLAKIVNPQNTKSKTSYTNALDSAKNILSGESNDFTQGALFFWNPNIKQTYAKDFVKNVNTGFYKKTGKTIVGNNLHEYLRPSDVPYEIPSENPASPFDRKIRNRLANSEVNPSLNQFASATEEDSMYKGSFLGNVFNRQARGASLQTGVK